MLAQVPFTIVEQYTPLNASIRGYFNKNAKMPGGSLLNLPTVVVDVTADTMILYSCISPLHAAKVNELVLASKSKAIDDPTLDRMKATARSAGIDPALIDQLKRVDHSKC